MTYFLIYLAAVNFAAFVMYGIDKRKAIRGKWRTPESALLGIAIAGGSLGAWAGMYAFRHKTRHKKFVIGVPLVIIFQAAVFFLVL
jgi:uncharacterized membrane protein YsdA (DUF1294 family)